MPPDYGDVGFIATGLVQWSPQHEAWPHWSKLYGNISGTPLEQRHKSFFPLVRFSKRFLGEIHEDMKDSSGMCEVYVPTLCALRGCRYAPVPPDKLGGEFAYVYGEPYHRCSMPGVQDHRWYHPCKVGLRRRRERRRALL